MHLPMRSLRNRCLLEFRLACSFQLSLLLPGPANLHTEIAEPGEENRDQSGVNKRGQELAFR